MTDTGQMKDSDDLKENRQKKKNGDIKSYFLAL